MGDLAREREIAGADEGSDRSSGGDAGADIFAAALKSDIDPAQTENDAQQVLYDIGGQFDSGEFDRLGPSAFSSMRLVALAWARMGWAKFLRGENLAAMQFLNSAWLLSESGTVANRLGQVYEKQGQVDKARHMYALAVAAGGASAADSRERLGEAGRRIRPSLQKELAQAAEELAQSRTVKLGQPKLGPLKSRAINGKSALAKFNLVFDGSPQPERAEFVEGDDSLRAAGEQMRDKDFPVRFPDASSIKIVRHGELKCDSAGCVIELFPID